MKFLFVIKKVVNRELFTLKSIRCFLLFYFIFMLFFSCQTSNLNQENNQIFSALEDVKDFMDLRGLWEGEINGYNFRELTRMRIMFQDGAYESDLDFLDSLILKSKTREFFYSGEKVIFAFDYKGEKYNFEGSLKSSPSDLYLIGEAISKTKQKLFLSFKKTDLIENQTQEITEENEEKTFHFNGKDYYGSFLKGFESRVIFLIIPSFNEDKDGNLYNKQVGEPFLKAFAEKLKDMGYSSFRTNIPDTTEFKSAAEFNNFIKMSYSYLKETKRFKQIILFALGNSAEYAINFVKQNSDSDLVIANGDGKEIIKKAAELEKKILFICGSKNISYEPNQIEEMKKQSEGSLIQFVTLDTMNYALKEIYGDDIGENIDSYTSLKYNINPTFLNEIKNFVQEVFKKN